jgi:predicted NBD/HSP70 family sugar kinase
LTAREVVASAQEGDAGCRRILVEAAALVGDAVRLLQRLLDPEVVVLGGGLMNSDLFAGLVIGAAAPSGPQLGAAPVVRVSGLGEESVILGGMATLAAGQGPCP